MLTFHKEPLDTDSYLRFDCTEEVVGESNLVKSPNIRSSSWHIELGARWAQLDSMH